MEKTKVLRVKKDAKQIEKFIGSLLCFIYNNREDFVDMLEVLLLSLSVIGFHLLFCLCFM